MEWWIWPLALFAVTFAIGVVVLTAAAVLAAALPAWRAARTSPMIALRSE